MKTVLFDLDGILLPFDRDIFIQTYVGLRPQTMVPDGYETRATLKNHSVSLRGWETE